MRAEKECTRCHVTKIRDEFRVRTGKKAAKDGLNSTCRKCDAELAEEYRERKREENPLEFCDKCQTEKHYSLFGSQTGLKGKCICLDCRKLMEEGKQKQKESNAFEFRIQHRNGTKRCSKCRVFKPYDQFWKATGVSDGFYPRCIDCIHISWEEQKERRYKNGRDWRGKNKDRAKQLWNKWDNNRRKTDPVYNLQRNVMHAIVASVRKYGFKNLQTQKLNKTIFDHLPYTAEELKFHIESLWESWMNWSNYGKFDANKSTWQIDHIIPQSALPFADMKEENFQKLWALSNLRPLETVANIRKSNKMPDAA